MKRIAREAGTCLAGMARHYFTFYAAMAVISLAPIGMAAATGPEKVGPVWILAGIAWMSAFFWTIPAAGMMRTRNDPRGPIFLDLARTGDLVIGGGFVVFVLVFVSGLLPNLFLSAPAPEGGTPPGVNQGNQPWIMREIVRMGCITAASWLVIMLSTEWRRRARARLSLPGAEPGLAASIQTGFALLPRVLTGFFAAGAVLVTASLAVELVTILASLSGSAEIAAGARILLLLGTAPLIFLPGTLLHAMIAEDEVALDGKADTMTSGSGKIAQEA